jgi:hypothetical protein
MKKLTALQFRFLPNAAHFSFMEHVSKELTRASDVVRVSLVEQIPRFDEWMAKETTLMLWVRKSELTIKINEADRRIGRILSAMSAQIRVGEYSRGTPLFTAAKRLRVIFLYFGHATHQAYSAQMGYFRVLLNHLYGDYAPDVAIVGLEERREELQAAFDAFVSLVEQRDERRSRKLPCTFPDVRRGINKVYHEITAIVNAAASLRLSPEYDAFIDALNPEIERLNQQFHHTRRDIALAQPAPIAPQRFTGKPLTPVPEDVYCVTKKGIVNLVLGKDYNLTYRNNVGPGNAQCTLQGKGTYHGSKTVTFIINK